MTTFTDALDDSSVAFLWRSDTSLPGYTHQVLARALWIALDVAADADMDVDAICEGLPFDKLSVRRRSRVDWEHYCVCVERIEEMAGGPDGLRALTRAHYYEGGVPEFRALAGMFVSPKALLRIIYEILDPLAFPVADFVYREKEGDEVRVETWLHPGVRPCAAFFRGSTGALEALPVALGLPAATVEEEEIAGTYAIFNVRVPPLPKKSAVARSLSKAALSRVVSSVTLGAMDDGQPFGAVLSAAGSNLDAHVELAAHSWTLTPRQTQVLRVLATGKSNKEIANILGCAEGTVELHVTQILGRAEASSRAVLIARVWSEF